MTKFSRLPKETLAAWAAKAAREFEKDRLAKPYDADVPVGKLSTPRIVIGKGYYTAADFDYLPEGEREDVAELVNNGSHIAATVTRNRE